MKKLVIACLLLAWTHAEGYDRKLYRHWIDEDKDCQSTRVEVLIEESLKPVRLDESGCRVLEGLWHCPYTGKEFTDPKMLDIDHYVPLAEAHESGGHAWDKDKRKAYANDLENPNSLIAVYRGANRSKGKKDPALWMPPNPAYRCEYAAIWLSTKLSWGLSFDQAERKALLAILGECLQSGTEPDD